MGMSSSSLPPPVAGETFEILTRGSLPIVQRLVRRLGVPEADEMDVIQEVFLAFHQSIGRGLDVGTSHRAWVKKTAYRVALDRVKLACNAREVRTKEEKHMQRIDLDRLMNELLDELPPDLRLVLMMSDVDTLPMSEIADLMGMVEVDGYSHLDAARREFASAWDRRREEQGPRAADLGLATYMLFDAHGLLRMERELSELPVGFEDEVWNRLVEALGPGLSWGGAGLTAGATAGAAAARGAGKSAGVLLTATQMAAVVVASALAGAGLYALIAALRAGLL